MGGAPIAAGLTPSQGASHGGSRELLAAMNLLRPVRLPRSGCEVPPPKRALEGPVRVSNKETRIERTSIDFTEKEAEKRLLLAPCRWHLDAAASDSQLKTH